MLEKLPYFILSPDRYASARSSKPKDMKKLEMGPPATNDTGMLASQKNNASLGFFMTNNAANKAAIGSNVLLCVANAANNKTLPNT